MEITKKIMKIKLLKMTICFILCLATLTLTFMADYQEVHAAPLIIGGIAIPAAVQIIGALLVAAGLTWAYNEAVDAAADWYFSEIAPGIRQGVIDMVQSASNGIANVSEEVWNATVDWVNSRYDVGTNDITKKYYIGAITIVYGSDPVTVNLPVNYNVAGTPEFPVGLPVGQNVYIGNDYYTVNIVSEKTTSVNVAVWKNGASWASSWQVNKFIPWCVYLEAYDTYNIGVPQVRFRMRGAPAGQTQYGADDMYYLTVPNATVSPAIPGTPINVSATGQSVVDTAHDIVMQDGVTRAITYPSSTSDLIGKVKSDVVVTSQNPPITPYSNSWQGTFRDCVPEGAFTFEGTGTTTIGYDTSGTWEGVWSTDSETGARVWTGTFTDAQSNTWSGTITGQVVDNRTWLENLLSGQLIAGTLAQIKAAIEGLTAPIIAAITGAATAIGSKVQEVTDAITGVADNTAEADMTPKVRQYKLPDLFVLILKVILACIRLVLRALVFVATLPAIPADAGNINGDFLSGVNFLKNQQIPYFNLSLWSMVTGVIAIFFGIAVVKRIRRLYSV